MPKIFNTFPHSVRPRGAVVCVRLTFRLCVLRACVGLKINQSRWKKDVHITTVARTPGFENRVKLFFCMGRSKLECGRIYVEIRKIRSDCSGVCLLYDWMLVKNMVMWYMFIYVYVYEEIAWMWLTGWRPSRKWILGKFYVFTFNIYFVFI